MITIKQTGDLRKTKKFLLDASTVSKHIQLDEYALKGVEALKAATPQRTGLTAESWVYEIEKSSDSIKIIWSNTNVVNGVPIAIILEYGHGTGTGGFVAGRNYITPAIQPIFDEIETKVWMEVTNS